VPVITAEDKPEALSVIAKTAQENNAPLMRLAEPSTIDLQPSTSLLGAHQKLNAALAVATVEVLQPRIPVTSAQLQAGLAQVHWPGRMQLIKKLNGQKILLDGAHNLAGAEVLGAALAKDFPTARPTFIVGALADKQWLAIGRTLAPLAAKIFTVPVASKRTTTATELAQAFSAGNPVLEVVAYENLAAALAACQAEPLVVITGSLYLVGEALELLGMGAERVGERGLNEWSTAKR
jgi:dihydrofolate synthase/folylpolyglutamate synthase